MPRLPLCQAVSFRERQRDGEQGCLTLMAVCGDTRETLVPFFAMTLSRGIKEASR